MQTGGLTTLLERMPAMRGLVVLNYHRIGEASATPYDPGNFSGTADDLYEHIRLFRRRHTIVTLDEAIDLALARRPAASPAILITFDDGYRDNWSVALPVLESLNAPAAFFLVPAFLDGNTLPWWDVIAYVVKHSRRRRFTLTYPTRAKFDVEHGLEAVIRGVLRLYKSPATKDTGRFMQRLHEACDCGPPAPNPLLFLSWRQAQQLANRGIAVGSHTLTHQILSKLPGREQAREVLESRALLERRLGVAIRSLAYPVGQRHTFSPATKQALHHAGYAVGFSHYGGSNRPPRVDPYDVRRFTISGQPSHRLRLQLATYGYVNRFL